MTNQIMDSLQWFFEFIGNACNTIYSLFNYSIPLPFTIGPFGFLPPPFNEVDFSEINVLTLILGGGLIILLIYKIIQWLAPIL